MTDTSHKAASQTLREIASWQPGRGSADSDLLPELDTIVARSRDLTRNHGIAAGAMQTLSDNIVGTGFRLSAKPDYKALGKSRNGKKNGRHMLKVYGDHGPKLLNVMQPNP